MWLDVHPPNHMRNSYYSKSDTAFKAALKYPEISQKKKTIITTAIIVALIVPAGLGTNRLSMDKMPTSFAPKTYFMTKENTPT